MERRAVRFRYFKKTGRCFFCLGVYLGSRLRTVVWFWVLGSTFIGYLFVSYVGFFY